MLVCQRLAFGLAQTDIEGTKKYETCGLDGKYHCGTAVEAELLHHGRTRESGNFTVLGILCLVLAACYVLYVMSRDFMVSKEQL
jgi:hypothetical protein